MKVRIKIVLLGAGGYCSGVIDSINRTGKYEVAVITDPTVRGVFCGVPVLGTDDILPRLYENGITHAHITVGSIWSTNYKKKISCDGGNNML